MTKRESPTSKPLNSEENSAITAPPASPKNEFERIQSLNDLAKDLKNEAPIGVKIRLATKRARELTDADMAFFCSVDRAGENYVVNAVFGDAELNEKLQGTPVPSPTELPRETEAGECIPVHFGEQHSAAPLFADRMRQLGVTNGMAAPLRVKDRHLGFLFAGNRRPVEFTETEQCLLSLVGNLLAAEIDRKRTEKEHERLETVLEQAAETIMITDRDGIIQYVNPSFEAISGYTRQEVIGKRPNFLHSSRQDAGFYQKMWETLRAGDIWRGHLVNRRKDGKFYEVEGSISPIKNDRGEITDYVSVRKDVTQESLLRKQLYQAQKMEAIGTLAGGIAHDFNNLMMGIQGNTSLMRMEMPPDSAVQERCRTIEELVKKGAALTRQLLGIAKGGKYQQIPMDISELVTASLEMFGRTKKEIQTHLVTDTRPCVVEMDPGQIDQVLLNLFVNAWQAMSGGGDLYVETALVSMSGRDADALHLKPGPYVKISVRDTGSGIDKSIVDRIFDPFFTTKEKSRGTGLGLASTYGIIKNHGGIIQARSEVNKGAEFEIYLPASDKTSLEIDHRAAYIAKGRETILLVDDEDAVLDICGEMLKRLGYNVITAMKGDEAVARFEAGKDDIDLVVLDLIMPGVRGEEVYDRLVALKPEVRVLLSSGYSLKDQARRLLSRGAVGFIQKPYSVTDLSQKIRQLLSNS